MCKSEQSETSETTGIQRCITFSTRTAPFDSMKSGEQNSIIFFNVLFIMYLHNEKTPENPINIGHFF